MKKKIAIINIILIFIVSIVTSTFAATGTVSLTTKSTEVKQGETFSVTLKANSESGINGINTTYTYDTTKLELISEDVVDKNWLNLGGDSAITVICNTRDTVKSADIYTLTFKVKESATVGSVAKIETGKILLDTDASTDSKVNLDEQKVEVTIKAKSSTGTDGTGTDKTGTDGTGTDKTGTDGTGTDKTGTDKTGTDGTGTDKTGTEKTGTEKTGTDGTDKTSTDTTKSSSADLTETTQKNAKNPSTTYTGEKLPNTGINTGVIIVCVFVVIIAGTVFYKKSIKYKGIK